MFDRTGSFAVGFMVNSILIWLAVFALAGLSFLASLRRVRAVAGASLN
jgi:hypothetical protein